MHIERILNKIAKPSNETGSIYIIYIGSWILCPSIKDLMLEIFWTSKACSFTLLRSYWKFYHLILNPVIKWAVNWSMWKFVFGIFGHHWRLLFEFLFWFKTSVMEIGQKVITLTKIWMKSCYALIEVPVKIVRIKLQQSLAKKVKASKYRFLSLGSPWA